MQHRQMIARNHIIGIMHIDIYYKSMLRTHDSEITDKGFNRGISLKTLRRY